MYITKQGAWPHLLSACWLLWCFVRLRYSVFVITAVIQPHFAALPARPGHLLWQAASAQPHPPLGLARLCCVVQICLVLLGKACSCWTGHILRCRANTPYPADSVIVTYQTEQVKAEHQNAKRRMACEHSWLC